MNDYDDRTVDAPHTLAGDRPVAGRPAHAANRPTDEHADEHTGERAEARAGETAEAAPVDDHTGQGHAGEPFGTEKPIIVAEGARPTAANEFTVDRLLEPEAAERFRDRWRDVKAVFVDDPADAVRQAGTLSCEAIDELTAALGRLRRELDGAWDEGRETDTERLRVALRGYGSLIDRILTR
jgi:hypothetical protein